MVAMHLFSVSPLFICCVQWIFLSIGFALMQALASYNVLQIHVALFLVSALWIQMTLWCLYVSGYEVFFRQKRKRALIVYALKWVVFIVGACAAFWWDVATLAMLEVVGGVVFGCFVSVISYIVLFVYLKKTRKTLG